MNRKLIITIAAVLITALIPIFSWSLTLPKLPDTSPLTSSVSVNVSGGGRLYWEYGKNSEFFLSGGWNSLNDSCKVRNGEIYKISSIIPPGLIVRSDDGWYFDGFFTSSGQKISSIKVKSVDILRVTKKGKYYYDYYPSGENPKNYLKSVYGTTVFKTLDRTLLYTLPQNSKSVYAKFKAKTNREYKAPSDYSMVYGDPGFFIWPNCPDEDNAVYRASSSKLLTVNKASGFCQIQGEGVATVTITFPETEKYNSESVKVKVRIRPPALSGVSARIITVKGTKKAEVKWANDVKSSGCEIQVSDTAGFSKILAKKTVSSGKTSVTTVSLSKKNYSSAKYIRIRPLKRSCNEKLYGPYTLQRIK